MAVALRVLVAIIALTQGAAAIDAEQAPVGARAAAIDRLLADADAARLRADFKAMQALSENAVTESRAIDDRLRLARSLTSVGQSLFFQTQLTTCVPILREAAAVVAPLDAPDTELVIANGLANCLRGADSLDEAIDWYRHSADLSRMLRNPGRESNALANITVVYTRLGEFNLALESGARAVARARESGDPKVEAYALQCLGNAEMQSSNTDRSAATHRQALARAEAMPPSPFVTLFKIEEQVNLTMAEYLGGRYESAAATGALTLDMIRSSPYPLAEATTELALGWSAYRRHRLDEAERWFVQARQAWRLVDDTSAANDMLLTEIGYALVLRATGRSAEALAVDEAAIVALDRLRAGRNVTDTSGATALLPSTRVYADTIDLLVTLGRTAEAFDLSERYRARLFLDTLDDQRSGIGQSMTDAERARETKLSTDGTRLQMRLWDANTTDAMRASLKSQLATIDQDLDALRRDVRRRNPRQGAVRFPVLLTAADVIRTLAPDTVVVSYLVGDERSFAFALTSKGVMAASLPGAKNLETHVAAFRDALSTRPSIGANRVSKLRAQASALTATLLDPVASSLAGRRRVIVIPDGVLTTLPFEALGAVTTTGTSVRGQWLTEQFAVSYAPSWTALSAIDARRPERQQSTLLALGDPDLSASASLTRDSAALFTALPATRVEVQRIAKVFGAASRTLVGAAATPDALLREHVETFRYVHLAAHAFVNVARPGRSGILLSPNRAQKSTGVLQADDVMKLTLNADLVTLSACSTGLGRTIAGEGVMGLARSFLIAGARSVTASLWNVNDDATAVLMQQFYGNLKAGQSRDDALSAARRSLIHGTNERLKDPYYWAPFILIGTK